MLPRTQVRADIASRATQALLAPLVADHLRLTRLTEGLASSSRRGMQQLVEAIGARLETVLEMASALATGASDSPGATSLQGEILSIRADLEILSATLEGRVDPPSRRRPGTQKPQETSPMSRKPWLFDPEDVPELEIPAADDLAEDDDWDDDWEDWRDDDDDDDEDDDFEPMNFSREAQHHAGGWREQRGSRGHRRRRSHRQL